jgi:hypothetical protein
MFEPNAKSNLGVLAESSPEFTIKMEQGKNLHRKYA